MIARQTKLQLLVFVIISVVGLTYTAVTYAGLGKYLGVDNGYLVSADFADSGGIFQDAEVTYNGVPVGTVEALELIPDGVRVTLRLEPGTQVPDDTEAVVGNRSAVGEQFVDLQPTRDGEPFLDAGDVIPMASTDIPISPTTLIVNLDDFVSSVDNEELAIVLDELGQAFDGAGESLTRLVDNGDVLTQAAIDTLPEQKALLRDGEIALNTQRDVGGQFRSFNEDLALLTTTLRETDPDFRRLFDNGTRSAASFTTLIENNRTALPILLDNLITVAQIQKVRLPAIRQTLVTYPNVVAGGFTVVPGDGTSHFGLVTEPEPPTCFEGYESTVERDPEVTSIRPNADVFCANSEGETNVRGARNIPRPGGLPPYPDDRPADVPSAPDGSSEPNQSRLPSIAEDEVALGDYDPISGNVITEEGHRFTLGSTAGAAARFGDDSWKWLVLNPLSE